MAHLSSGFERANGRGDCGFRMEGVCAIRSSDKLARAGRANFNALALRVPFAIEVKAEIESVGRCKHVCYNFDPTLVRADIVRADAFVKNLGA